MNTSLDSLNENEPEKLKNDTVSNEPETEKCSICYENLDNDTVKCLHKFHYNCILLTYKTSYNNINSYSYKRRRECPYCRRDGGYLPLKMGVLPIKHIHKEYDKYIKDTETNNLEKWEKYFIKNKCKAILKSGKNAGNQCSKNLKGDSKYCSMHKKYYQAKTLLVCEPVIL